jgi:hypothetical protein
MSGPDPNDAFDDAEPQDSAEALDETNYDDGEFSDEMRTFEELPDVLDVTRAEGDNDDDAALAIDADEFDEEAVGDDLEEELEEDDELHYRAATEEHEDDIDGLGPEDAYDEDAIDTESSIEGLDEEVQDADEVLGGEDDTSNFQARDLSDDDLERMGYSEVRDGQTRAKPDR